MKIWLCILLTELGSPKPLHHLNILNPPYKSVYIHQTMVMALNKLLQYRMSMLSRMHKSMKNRDGNEQ